MTENPLRVLWVKPCKTSDYRNNLETIKENPVLGRKENRGRHMCPPLRV
jgi:hypothetical protein